MKLPKSELRKIYTEKRKSMYSAEAEDLSKSIFEQFIKNWYELLEIFFDEKEYWDSFYIEQKDEETVFELEKIKKRN